MTALQPARAHIDIRILYMYSVHGDRQHREPRLCTCQRCLQNLCNHLPYILKFFMFEQLIMHLKIPLSIMIETALNKFKIL